jgi:hypothetical protein
VNQVHDFNPGIGSNGLFWIVQVPDDAVKVTDDTVTISLKNVAVVDQHQFNFGVGASGVPATVSFDITYQKTPGTLRRVRPTSTDPLSPFAWAGKMWMATNSGTFSVTYKDGSFSAKGSFSSAGNFGELGTEKNGSFVRHRHEDGDDQDDGDDESGDNQDKVVIAAPEVPRPAQSPTNLAGGQWNAVAAQSANVPKFRGKVPVEYFVH